MSCYLHICALCSFCFKNSIETHQFRFALKLVQFFPCKSLNLLQFDINNSFQLWLNPSSPVDPELMIVYGLLMNLVPEVVPYLSRSGEVPDDQC